MDKVLVKLYVPMIEEKYDVWVPVNKKLHNIIKLFTKAIFELTDGKYNPDEMPMLYDRLKAKQYDINLSVKENNIKNGTEIVLI